MPPQSSPAEPFRHDFPFDPRYGYDQDQLLTLRPPPPPPDFAAFWQSAYARAREIPPRPVLKEVEGNATERIHEISYFSWEGLQIRGWLVHPRQGRIRRGFVCGHGYGGRQQPEPSLLGESVTLYPCMRGLSLSELPGVPNVASGHVLHGIEQRDTYIHLGCAADIWCGFNALEALYPGQLERLDYMGGSFGGGIGALALPWEVRVTSAFLRVPSFGNHPLRLRCPCVGSGEAVRTYAAEHPEVITDVLPYFDAAIAAASLRIPVLVAAALFDPAVPPPGQFSVYNALAGRKELHILPAGHFEFPDQGEVEEKTLQRLRRFFTDPPISA